MHLSSSLHAVMKSGTATWEELVQHKMNIATLDHSRTGFYRAFIVLAVPSVPTMPSMCALHHPAFCQRCASFCALRTHRDVEAPPGTRRRQPGCKDVIVILLIRQNHAKTRQGSGCDVCPPSRGRHTIIPPCPGNEHGDQPAPGLHQQMPLAPVDFFPTVIPARGAPNLRGLDRLASDARGAGSGLASRFHAVPFAQGMDEPCPGPVLTPLGKKDFIGNRLYSAHADL